MTDLNVRRAETRFDYAACVYLRTIVFFGEQNVPFPEEINEQEDEAVYFTCWLNNLPVATARYRILDDNTGKIERVCVHPDHRGKGYGREIMMHIIEDLLANPDIQKIKLSSQDHAIPFYESLGFQTIGDGFIEAEIPHHMMERKAA